MFLPFLGCEEFWKKSEEAISLTKISAPDERWTNSLPHNDVFRRNVFGLAHSHLTLDVCCVVWRRDAQNDIVAAQLRVKVGPEIDVVLYP